MSSKLTEVQTARTLNTTTPRGTLFVVSSPSGGGKGTIIEHVLEKVENLSYSVSYTTRAPRSKEIAGREYFLDRKSTRLNSSHSQISYAVFCLKKKKTTRCW